MSNLDENYVVENEVIEENDSNGGSCLLAGAVGVVVGILAHKGFQLVRNKIQERNATEPERKLQLFNLKEDQSEDEEETE